MTDQLVLDPDAARAVVVAVAAELLGLDAPAPDLLDQDPYDLGLDSLALFRLRARLAQRTRVALDVLALMEAPTLDDIAMRLVRQSQVTTRAPSPDSAR